MSRRGIAEFCAKGRIASRRPVGHIRGLMNATQFLKTRVPAQTKELVRAAAEREYVTESIWFRRAVERALREQHGADGHATSRRFQDGRIQEDESRGQGARLYVRLRPDDRMLLRERSVARGMPAATYASVLLRSHLRNLPPLPKDELLALKATVAELGAIGRNLNQIARAANQGGRVAGPTREDLRALLKVCEALREHVKGLVSANVTSWAVGYAEAPH
jgi:hypothetical protein